MQMRYSVKHTVFLPSILLGFALTTLAHPAAAQADKDMSEIQHCTLTMSNVAQFMKVTSEFKREEKDNPSAEKETPDDQKSDDGDNIASATKRIESVPQAVQILQNNGLKPHEYIVLMVTIMQAAMASSMKPANESDADYAAKTHINPANLAFFRDHKDELDALKSKYPQD